MYIKTYYNKMWLLHKNYAVTTKLSNPVSIVPKCWDTSDMPKCPRSEVWKVWSVLGPKCLYTLHCSNLSALAWDKRLYELYFYRRSQSSHAVNQKGMYMFST